MCDETRSKYDGSSHVSCGKTEHVLPTVPPEKGHEED